MCKGCEQKKCNTTQNIILKQMLSTIAWNSSTVGKKVKKISKRGRLRGSLGRGKATEPGDMPLMSLIHPPVIDISTSQY